MTQRHVMSQRVDGATMDRCEVCRENDAVPSGILLEEQELGVVRKRSAIVQIDI